MPDLTFGVLEAVPEPGAATPTLRFPLRVTNGSGEPVHGALVRVQVRIEPAGREYGAAEAERLRDLFGPRELWGESQRPLLWTNATLTLPSFRGEAVADLLLPVSLDLDAAATKLFRALESDVVPLAFHFSGTVFYEAAGGALQAAPISWAREARFRLPVATWQSLVERYYPDRAFLAVPRDLLARLEAYKSGRGFPTWEQALESLLA